MTADVQVQEEVVRKVMAMTQVDRDGLRDAYSDVRDDKSECNWAVFKYDGSQVIVSAKGQTFDDFKAQFGDDERAFAYLRLQTGDEMSKRSKFLLVTWVGTGVSPIKKAKMSTDKALVKEILSNFAVELTVETASELNHEAFLQELVKAGGANYGTGIRE
ncbi:coactosin-like protein isoform X3 [Procambarus clarkii]|uniref:coactosin-like protein isoform X3 n=1 Tax=Procambarus clarkii TaxID=6728 RepID=UPI001E674E87|nr:coactosin-like protein isoform X2 [Procambarus clarkii]